MTNLKSKLLDMDACPDAVKWVGRRGPKTAWRDCKRGDWMLWAAARLGVDRKLLVLTACDCAEIALKYVPEGEDRPAKAIATARAWCEGDATIEDCQKAAYAADAAAYAANAAADAVSAVSAAYAAYAAAYAADAAADSAAYAANAHLVRARIPYEVIAKALEAKP